MIERHNPVINVETIPEYYSADDRLGMDESKFRMAFTVEGYYDLERKDDPRYVKYLIQISERRDGTYYRSQLTYHECTEADYA